MIWAWLIAASAAAEAPEREAATLETGGGAVIALHATDAGDIVTFATSSVAGVLHVPTWQLHTVEPCSIADAVPGAVTDSSVLLYVGCADGTIRGYTYEDQSLSAAAFSSGSEWEAEVFTRSLERLVWDANAGLLHAIGIDSDTPDNAVVVAVDSDGVLGTEALLVRTEVRDVAVDVNGILYVAHSRGEMTQLSLGTTTAALILDNVNLDLSALTGRPLGGVWALDGDLVAEHLASGTGWTYLLTGLEGDPSTLAVLGEEEESYLALAGEQVEFYPLSGASLESLEPEATLTTSTTLDALAWASGYAIGGGASGQLAVLTSNPWLDEATIQPDTAGDGTPITVGFTSDKAGSWQVRLGGDWTRDGTLLASGDLTEPGAVEVELVVGDAWAEGANDVWFFVEDDDGRVGHAWGSVAVDNPPGTPVLSEGSVGFEDSALQLSFTALEDADLDFYTVYVSTAPFDAADWPAGGPVFDGADELEAPIVVDAQTTGTVTVRIAPLTNDQTYYIAVRATDEAGVEGPMSEVVTGSPRATFGAADLADETGGSSCAVAPAGGLGVIGLGALALLARRRRASAAAVVVAAGLAVGSSAEAADNRGDLTPAWGNVELRYGPISFADEDIASVYGSSGNQLLLEGGVQLFRMFELDVGVGFLQELAYKLDDNGRASSQRTMLTWYPLSLQGTFRLHLWDEQPVTPFVAYGRDWIIWSEKSDSTTADANGDPIKDVVSGLKHGHHISVGGSLLLDTFARGRASLLEAQSGVNDTSLVFEWRIQRVNPGEGLSFNGSGFTLGLKLDF